MLGEQYGELKGKVIGQRVLDVEGPTIETSVSASGTVKGMSVQEMITFIGTPTAEKGVIHGVGKGVLSTTGGGGEPEMVPYTGEGLGSLDSSGSMKWRGCVFYLTRKQYYSKTSDPGSSHTSHGEEEKLSVLNNLVGLFESEIDAAGNFSEKLWEWK
jgi:hypothetical protein